MVITFLLWTIENHFETKFDDDKRKRIEHKCQLKLLIKSTQGVVVYDVEKEE